MIVDRVRFLQLSVLLASSCHGAEPVTVKPAPEKPAPPPTESVQPPCDNAVGTLAACANVTPACEGLHEECGDLLSDFRPRVAAAFATCFARANPKSCRGKALGACMRTAVESACVEPETVPVCESIMAACNAAGKHPKYSLSSCTKVLSAVPTSDDPSSWRRVNEERLGPSAKGGCSLEHVLAYQPYGPSWR